MVTKEAVNGNNTRIGRGPLAMAEAVQLKSREETACSRNHFPPNKDTTYINIYIYIYRM